MIRLSNGQTITPKNLEDEFSEEQKKWIVDSDQLFVVPSEITNNKDKQVYRIGFLTEFLKRLYPELSRNKIYEILEERYQIFLSRRQIERHVKAFLEQK